MSLDVQKIKGFTVIELLIVITIIGILSAMLLASLSTARNKGRDARIQTQMKGVQNAAAIYYSIKGNYGLVSGCAGTFAADPVTAKLFTASSWPDSQLPYCLASGATYGAYVSSHALISDPAKSWCVDSNGASKQITGIPGGATCG